MPLESFASGIFRQLRIHGGRAQASPTAPRRLRDFVANNPHRTGALNNIGTRLSKSLDLVETINHRRCECFSWNSTVV